MVFRTIFDALPSFLYVGTNTIAYFLNRLTLTDTYTPWKIFYLPSILIHQRKNENISNYSSL